MKTCKVRGCNNTIICKNVCWKHYNQLRLYGKILKRTIRDKNKIVDCGNYYEICLYNVKCKEVARAKIDKEDFNKVKNYKWGICSQGYAKTTIIQKKERKKAFYLHQLIIGKKQNFITDHINRDKLDNRKQNLRHCTHQQNMMNSVNKGCNWLKENKKWRALIVVNGKNIHLGLFTNKKEAILIKRKAEKKYFGKFAS